ncbi:MAG: hypothetical protein A2639_01725 [Candidatus Staskawiczbacteria bacterium RIFCSPHIGHO2_01_FULL_34_27]|uniref:Uncharacterized protein n=2 Tax=Candidatus Staskawicziibacteriota TaxID=1817916 RepID=A0A1G2HNA1_9BACT|nr:MAG: hypothetical protein UR31_C0011G0011 [Parcubacteria group bacterium GW2011_GWA2_33_14]OGZ63368.1 MAG: hypothetical protein A2639_01725 [Candidatus Staskawiczbacteria bacterium RIFCSPHIGHO2_01_FULL_34_27]OGZ65851.1 MAG: hypothetical protein A3D34_03335 [Candidatus Staskawiczbacteria bacterium RIFCSPHIGHO2_02_FULL_33_16]OGZ70507.1 MAG: hypothetical protein A2980_00975 [Candidatus Staskawiczbacteria bacterium RIFCSPLOWO2_01_FULL_33_13]
MKNIFISILKQIGKLFIGIFLGITIELFTGIGLSYLVEKFYTVHFDPGPFVVEYPLLIILLLGIYLVFWKKQYALTMGMFLGAIIFIFSLGIVLTGT